MAYIPTPNEYALFRAEHAEVRGTEVVLLYSDGHPEYYAEDGVVFWKVGPIVRAWDIREARKEFDVLKCEGKL